MANLENINVLVPETHSISQHLRVVSNYPLTNHLNDKDEIIRTTRSFEVSVSGGEIFSFSQILPKNNEAALKAIKSVHSGDTFRIAHMGVIPKAQNSDVSPSGGSKVSRAVRGFFNSPIILWNTFIPGDSGALYEGVVFPDLEDRPDPGERSVNFNKIKAANGNNEPTSADEEQPY